MFNKLVIKLCYKIPFFAKFFLKGRGFVFMLHRVLPQEKRGFDWNKSLAISPESLEEWINLFRKKGFDIVSMDEVCQRIKTKKGKKFIAFTMDDGYKDNLYNGLPIFKKLNVPCTIYVSNCFPNNHAVYWWYFLENYIKKNNTIDLKEIGITYKKTFSDSEKFIVYNEVRELLRKSDYGTQLNFALKICKIKDLKQINRSFNLTWDEVKRLSEDPLITIGGHTIHHISLKNQSNAVCKHEINKGTQELKDKIGETIKHFVYPYGSKDDYSIDLIELLEKNNYKSAVINHPGSILSNSREALYSIPRMGLTDETSIGKINDLFSGRVHLNFNGVSKEYI